MEVQIVKFNLTAEESERALPIVMSAIAGMTEIEAEQILPSPLAQMQPEIEEPKRLAPASDVPTIPVKIAAPTGPIKRIKGMRLRLLQRSWLDLFNRFQLPNLSRKQLLTISACFGAVSGGILLFLCIRHGYAQKLLDRVWATESQVLTAPDIPQEENIAPTEAEDTPADASEKSGIHGERPSFKRGVLE